MKRESEHMQAQLAALADDSLRSAGRERLLAEVQEHPDLAEQLARQREAVAILRSLEDLPAPAALRRSVESLVEDASQGRRHAGWGRRTGGRRGLLPSPAGWHGWASLPRRASSRSGVLPHPAGRRRRALLLPATALVAACAVALAIALSGGARRAPTVLQASRLALRPATLAAPQEISSNSNALEISVEGIHYPYWGASLGWQAVGARHDRLDGRAVTTVYYGSDGTPAGEGRLAYAIVGGKALAQQPGGSTLSARRIQFHVLRLQGETVLTWQRAGHTCIIVAKGVPVRTLVRLASWE
jgi:hypothetical protein